MDEDFQLDEDDFLDEDCRLRATDLNRLELAWAAGFWDGEGCSFVARGRYLSVTVTQVELEPLMRFRGAVVRGSICGPYQRGSNQPIYQWHTSGEDARQVLLLLWPYLSGPKKRRAEASGFHI